MRSTPFQALIFDFDGTLAALTIDFALMKQRLAALAEVFLEESISPDGLPVLEWVEQLAATVMSRHGRELSLEFHTRCRFLIMDMEIKAASQGSLFPTTRSMLTRLRVCGARTAVITRNCTPAVTAVFPDIAQHVDCLLPRESVVRVKPDPEHLLTALERLALPPEAALMIGDHPMDVLTGRRAGTATAAVASGRTLPEELHASGPDFLARDCAGLMALLEDRNLLPQTCAAAGH
ncbi:HAD family hydrolase [Desulfocurvibacter africanus]|uniref:phosphoglycolate phosphatase n=1 Tax=Desulfocurvibacter africanus subsp. africanus str. Walvis Bay TaxID=690850 RepID=F3YV11_DESAF|nr:HAD hydrolase-like protein [Desulfocurvibacter africanus]EGJ49261.1 HAD-superfamily hydrolase, subfamily IA, variant 1 [Desulfocurvibacter africanus subsp. africanus str. Walvis Bay]